MQPTQTIYEGFPSAHAFCWPPPPVPNTPGFERNPLSLQRNDPNYYPPVNQLNAWPSSIHQDRRAHEEVGVTIPFDRGQWAYMSQPPPRQAPTDQGMQYHKTYPLPGTAPMNYPVMRTYTVGAWPPSSEDWDNSNDRHAFNSAGRGGTNETHVMYGAANQMPWEGIAFPAPPLVRPPIVQFPSNYGGSEPSENGTNHEFDQWLESADDLTYPSRGFAPSSLPAIGEIQSSPETIPSLSPTPSLEVRNLHKVSTLHNKTQPKLRRVVPYPAPSGGKEEPRRKESKKIPVIPLSEAERVVGPEIHEYWGSKGKEIPDPLLWKTRAPVQGVSSIKETSKCVFCDSVCSGSAARYHARKHLNVNPHACQQPDCTAAFGQSSDLNSHVQKIHNKGSLQPPTLPTSSNNRPTPAYHE